MRTVLDAFATHRDRSRNRCVQHANDASQIVYLCCLALGVVEVGRHSDDSVGHLLAQKVLGGLLHLQEDHRANFFRGKGLLRTTYLHLCEYEQRTP